MKRVSISMKVGCFRPALSASEGALPISMPTSTPKSCISVLCILATLLPHIVTTKAVWFQRANCSQLHRHSTSPVDCAGMSQFFFRGETVAHISMQIGWNTMPPILVTGPECDAGLGEVKPESPPLTSHLSTSPEPYLEESPTSRLSFLSHSHPTILLALYLVKSAAAPICRN